MRRPKYPSSLNGSVNMTPMIDVIFLLIIFFLCVSQNQKAEIAETVELPSAKAGTAEAVEPTPPRRLILTVLPDGRLRSGGRTIPTAELADLLKREKELARAAPAKVAKPLEVWIRADRATPYRFVEPVLRNCAAAGVWKAAFKVTPDDGGRTATEAAP
ncbi:MAG: ExbD/TolR family protein [Planctomycetia bacterium]